MSQVIMIMLMLELHIVTDENDEGEKFVIDVTRSPNIYYLLFLLAEI